MAFLGVFWGAYDVAEGFSDFIQGVGGLLRFGAYQGLGFTLSVSVDFKIGLRKLPLKTLLHHAAARTCRLF